MSNYPPGVTGHEYAINGPDTETDGEWDCWKCEDTCFGVFQTYGYEKWFICDQCGETTEITA